MSKGDKLSLEKIEDLKHDTQPPARYTEGSLIKELERRGIGRPSTWATIVDVVLSRTYAFKKGSALVPSFVAMAVSALLEQYFPKLVDYEFTARLEEDLDNIANGEVDNLKYLRGFYHGEKGDGLHGLVSSGEEKIDPRIVCGYPIGQSADGKNVEVRIGKFGPFLSDGERKSSFPDSLCPDELTLEKALQILTDAAKGPTSLGADPASGKQVYLKIGRFGPYIQLGEMKEGEDKPKMASLIAGMSPDSVDFETALKLLAFPKNLGKHPTLGEDIVVANGKFGPYVKCGNETRSISTAEFSILDLNMDQAIEILSRPRTRKGQTVTKAAPLRELGKHPITELPLIIKSGKFGPYVTDGSINASLPRGVDIQSLSMEEAVNLLEARAAKIAAEGDNPDKKKRRGARGKPTKAKAAAKPKASKSKGKSKKA
jgi:DNA topoisomerase-1